MHMARKIEFSQSRVNQSRSQHPTGHPLSCACFGSSCNASLAPPELVHMVGPMLLGMEAVCCYFIFLLRRASLLSRSGLHRNDSNPSYQISPLRKSFRPAWTMPSARSSLRCGPDPWVTQAMSILAAQQMPYLAVPHQQPSWIGR